MGELGPRWKRVKFGDVVRQVKTKVDPQTSGIERYVAGEHMDTDDLRIRRWGEVDDGYLGPAFHMRFKPGQVLYGSRRTYLRKVAVADFEGICANTTFVLESADPAKLLPELLPFVMQTEAFHEHSKRESKGSVNPYVNFSDLAWYEFALPPLEEQQRIAALLGAWNEVREAHRDAEMRAETAVKSLLVHMFWPRSSNEWVFGEITPAMLPYPWSLVRAQELCSDLVTKGATPVGRTGSANTGFPFVKVYNLTFDGELDFTVEPTWISRDGHRELRRSVTIAGDVLTNIVGPPLGKVARVPDGFPESNINQAIVRYRPRDRLTGDWLEAYLLSPVAQAWLRKRAKKTSGQQNLTLETCRDLPVPMTPAIPELLAPLRSMRVVLANVKARRCNADAWLRGAASSLLAGRSGS